MKKRSKWQSDGHGAYCACETCADQDFNVHSDSGIDDELTEFSKGIRRDDGDFGSYIEDILGE